MPNPAKPVELKRLLGNPGQRALPDGPVVDHLPLGVGVPDPPRPLGAAGGGVWRAAWTAGRAWMSPTLDVEALCAVCDLADERVALRERVMANPDAVGLRRGLRELELRLFTGLGLLGMTPSSRAQMGLAEMKAMSKMEELRAKHAGPEGRKG